MHAPRLLQPRARRGSITVTAFVIIIAMLTSAFGVQLFLKEQIRQGTEMQYIGLGKLQVLYLAEMGLNHVMFEANRNPEAVQPFPVPTDYVTGRTFDFKQQVAMVRNMATGVATCTVVRRAADAGEVIGANQAKFQVQARLVCAGGTFTKVLNFSVEKKAGTGQQWVLKSYQVVS